MEENGLSVQDVSRKFSVDEQSVHAWLSSTEVPPKEILFLLLRGLPSEDEIVLTDESEMPLGGRNHSHVIFLGGRTSTLQIEHEPPDNKGVAQDVEPKTGRHISTVGMPISKSRRAHRLERALRALSSAGTSEVQHASSDEPAPRGRHGWLAGAERALRSLSTAGTSQFFKD